MDGGDLGSALSEMWRRVVLVAPTLVAFLVIMLLGYVIARMVRAGVTQVLRRIGFDRAVEHGGLGRVLRRGGYDATDVCARLAYYAVLLFTLQLAFGLWGPNPISDVIDAIVGWLPRAFVAIVIVVVAAAIAHAVRDLLRAALGGLSYGGLIGGVAYAFIVGLGVIAALEQVGIATAVTTPVLVAVLATIAGILIVGVGGGLVRPMQRRWEAWLDRAAAESQIIKERARAFAEAREAAGQAAAGQAAAGQAAAAASAAEAPVAKPAPTAERGVAETQVIPVQPDNDATQTIPPVGQAERDQAEPDVAASAEQTQVITRPRT